MINGHHHGEGSKGHLVIPPASSAISLPPAPRIASLVEEFLKSNKVAGINLPGFNPHSREMGVTEAVAADVGEFTRALAQRLGVDTLSAVLSEKGRLFIGLPKMHAHPNCWGDPLECAIGIAVTSGHHSFPLVATYSNASQKVPFNGTVLDRLAEHFVRTDRRMKILHVQDGGTEVYQHRQLLPSSKAGESRPSLKPRALCAYKKYDVELIRPGGVFIPPSFIASLAQDLKHVLPNSTADGETRPGRKRHAAGVFTLSGDVYFGVNLRSDVRSIDRCAEWNALSAALVGGHNEIAGVMVFSPDYNEGKVCCCGKCLDSLGDFMSSELGNMFIVYVSSEGRVSDPVLYSSLRPVSYKQAEAGSPKPSLS